MLLFDTYVSPHSLLIASGELMGEETGNEENGDLFSFDFVDKTTNENYNKIMSEEQKRNNEPNESAAPGSSDETGTKVGNRISPAYNC